MVAMVTGYHSNKIEHNMEKKSPFKLIWGKIARDGSKLGSPRECNDIEKFNCQFYNIGYDLGSRFSKRVKNVLLVLEPP